MEATLAALFVPDRLLFRCRGRLMSSNKSKMYERHTISRIDLISSIVGLVGVSEEFRMMDIMSKRIVNIRS